VGLTRTAKPARYQYGFTPQISTR